MLTLLSENRSFGGVHRRYRHVSTSNNCEMTFAVYLPPQALADSAQKVPALYWLSGLTCSDENFMQKAGAHRIAAELGIALIAPDTSPRGPLVATAPDGVWQLGLGAGYYLNATQAPWAQHYQMFDYVAKELPALVEAHLPITEVRAISGHSMGGHGALVLAMRNPGRYCSLSVFAPICHPSQSPWGRKAMAEMLGPNEADWHAFDAVHLIQNLTERLPILMDQGSADDSLANLMPEALRAAAIKAGHPLNLRMREGYDHGYYFVASFIESHLRYHAGFLLGTEALPNSVTGAS
jgi:S-formylglutathione hydrolase